MKPKKTNTHAQETKTNEMFYPPIKDRYIDPFTDFGFKKLFGQECNKDLLLDFLNELLHHEEGTIVSIRYLSPEKLGAVEDSRTAVFNLFCQNDKGEHFLVEMHYKILAAWTKFPMNFVSEYLKKYLPPPR